MNLVDSSGWIEYFFAARGIDGTAIDCLNNLAEPANADTVVPVFARFENKRVVEQCLQTGTDAGVSRGFHISL